MDFEMKIWDLPRTEKEVITFFHDKGLLPTTKHIKILNQTKIIWTQWTQNDFILLREGTFLEV